MRVVIKLTFLTCLASLCVAAQDRVRTARVGAYGEQTRVIIAFVDPLPEGYKMQSMIIDLTPLRKKPEEPMEIHLDLTSTVRSVVTGTKGQKILILNWKNSGDFEAKCDGNWRKQEMTPILNNIIATTKAVIHTLPSTPKEPKDFELSRELEQKILAIFNSLSSESVPCLRELH